MLGIIAYSDADIPNTLLRLPDWLTASMLVIGGIISVLIANALTVHTLRNTIGVHQTKPVRCRYAARVAPACVDCCRARTRGEDRRSICAASC